MFMLATTVRYVMLHLAPRSPAVALFSLMFTFDLPQNFCIYVTRLSSMLRNNVCVTKYFWIVNDCGVIFKVYVHLRKCYSLALHY